MNEDEKMSTLVTFIVVAYNAAATIEALLNNLKRQTYPHDLIEVILVDGCSRDGTKAAMLRFQNQQTDFRRVAVLDNPKRTLPCGWNVALDAAEGEALLRVDAHAMIPDRFVEKNVSDLLKGEDICGGKVISIPANKTKWAIVLNEAENSMFGGGVAAFRDKVGRYNERLTRTEDNEMHYRMRQAGYRFYYDPEIVSYRKTRSDLKGLTKQKYLNGYWIGRTLWLEPKCFSLYHFVPLAFVLAIAFSSLLCFFGIWWLSALVWGAYVIANLGMTIGAVINCRERNVLFVSLPFVFLVLHVWYGVGTIAGILSSPKK